MNLNSFRIPIIFLGLTIVTMLLYWPAMQCEFVGFDDPLYVTQNQHVREGLSGAGVRYAFSTFDTGNWHPLTWLSLELDARVWGLKPSGFHFTNVALHALNSA